MARRRKGRPVDGILVLDKAPGMTSNDAVQQAKRLFEAQKVGHTGSLDPLATGVLPLCFGEATKFSQYLLDSDKTYWTRIRLGVRTESGDADGAVIETRPVIDVDAARIEDALSAFRGQIEQVPSMYSAIKHKGQPLYKLARQGIEVERPARTVTIHENRLLSFADDLLELQIRCSKGTYVRTIAEDLGETLGCGAHVVALRRLAAGPFHLEQAHRFEALCAERQAAESAAALDPHLLPVGSAVDGWPELRLSADTAYYLKQGQPVIVPHAPSSGWVRLSRLPESETSEPAPAFIGVGEILEDGRVAPRRLVVER